jgi:Holliday junction DNA helicase RuvA
MIGLLRGTFLDRLPRGEVLVEVGGVGYRATVAPSTSAGLGSPGTEIVLHTHLHVREDALVLFGFLTRNERECFEALVGAHGVGPALALAILSVHSPLELHRAVADGDIDSLVLVPGVGRKTAARLLIELKTRLDVPDGDGRDQPAVNGNGSMASRAEVRAALASLGYDAGEVAEVVRQIPADGDVEELLRAALKLLAVTR